MAAPTTTTTTTTAAAAEDLSSFSTLLQSLSADASSLYAGSTSQLSTHLSDGFSSDQGREGGISSSGITGDSFLKLKSALLLSYTQHLALLTSHKMLGLSIDADDDDDDSDESDESDGDNDGDLPNTASSPSSSSSGGSKGKRLVLNLVRLRLLLEKMRPVESRLRPRWERLIRSAEIEESSRKVLVGDDGNIKSSTVNGDAAEEGADLDALSFRPNPLALLDASKPSSASTESSRKRHGNVDSNGASSSSSSSSVYRPPKLASVPYNPNRRGKGSSKDDGDYDDDDAGGGQGGAEFYDVRPDESNHHSRSGGPRGGFNRHLLSDLSSSLSTLPASLSSSGLSSLSRSTTTTTNPTSASHHGQGQQFDSSSPSSSKARRLAEMEAYEESNFTRLSQSKKEAKKRRRDERDVVLGLSTPSSARDDRGRRSVGSVGAGYEEEFGDLLRGSERKGKGGRGEFDALTKRRKASGPTGDNERGRGAARRGGRGGGGPPSGNRFEKAVQSHAKRGR